MIRLQDDIIVWQIIAINSSIAIDLPYSRKYLLDKSFIKHSYLCVAEIFGGIFLQYKWYM